MSDKEFEKEVAGDSLGIPKIFAKGGAWGIMAFFIGLAFYTFFLIPSLGEREQLNQERKKFIDATLESNAKLRSITAENKDTQKKMAETMVKIEGSVAEQAKTTKAIQSNIESQNELREEVIQHFDSFADCVKKEHPQQLELLKKIHEKLESPKP